MSSGPFPAGTIGSSSRQTRVVWVINEDFSTLYGLDAWSIERRIRSAIENNGYYGNLLIEAYVDENVLTEKMQRDIDETGLLLGVLPKGDKFLRINMMLVSVMQWALNVEQNSNVLILSEDIECIKKHSLTIRVCDALVNKGFHVAFGKLDSILGAEETP